MKTSLTVLALLILLASATTLVAQTTADSTKTEKQTKKKISFRDSQDGAFDVSDWVIEYNGFIPMPFIVTEPALGGFGAALAPIFIKQHAPVIINGKPHGVPPDVTVAFGGYTLNHSWAVGGGRMATIPKWGLRYKVMAAYANVNMDYYKTLNLPVQGETEFKFGINAKAIPVMLYLGKLFKDPRWETGVQYTFAYTDIAPQPDFDNHPYIDSLIGAKDYHSKIGSLGFAGSFDKRDNTFTPNNGYKISLNFMWNNPVFGSDYKYSQIEGAAYWYIPVTKWWICGLRGDMQQVWGDIPFYIKPYLDMRGIPTMRYQGTTTMLVETEQRFDVYKRWSIIALLGTGKAFDGFSNFKNATLAYNYGTGFRYLIARKLGLRMGIDVAKSNDAWGYYFVFGSGWMRQ